MSTLFCLIFSIIFPFLKKENFESFPFYTNEEKSLLKSTLILSELERKYGAGGYRQPYFFMPIFLNFAAEDKQLTQTKEYPYGREQQ